MPVDRRWGLLGKAVLDTEQTLLSNVDDSAYLFGCPSYVSAGIFPIHGLFQRDRKGCCRKNSVKSCLVQLFGIFYAAGE